MAGKWAKPGVPHVGWVCIDVEDLGTPQKTCGMCEHQTIRYVHHMRHSVFPLEIAAGCVCAGYMEEDPDAARNRQRQLKNEARRRHNRWKTSRNGNPYINVDGYNIVLYPAGQRWGCKITAIATGDEFGVKIRRNTLDEAKKQALVILGNLKQKG